MLCRLLFLAAGLKLKRDDPMEDMKNFRFVLRDTRPADEMRKTSRKFVEARWKKRNKLPKAQRNPVEAWPPELLFFFRVTLLLKGMCCELGASLRYMTVLAPYAQMALLKSFPTSQHSKQVVMPTRSANVTELEPLQRNVNQLLCELYEQGQIIGAQVAVYHNGVKIVDTCGGTMGPCDPRPVQIDTLFNCFSVTKAIASAAVLVCADQGKLGLSDFVVNHWPEFGKNGKATCTIEHILTHSAGLQKIATAGSETLKDLCSWEKMLEVCADAKPETKPGDDTKYHILSFGWLVGGIVQSVTKSHLRDFVRRSIAAPLGIEDEFYLGLGITGADDFVCSTKRIATLSNGLLDMSTGSMTPEELKEMIKKFRKRQHTGAKTTDGAGATLAPATPASGKISAGVAGVAGAAGAGGAGDSGDDVDVFACDVTIKRPGTKDPLGMKVSKRKDGSFTVDGMHPSSWSAKAGVQVDDCLLAINGTQLGGSMSLNQVLALLTANPTTLVTLERESGGDNTDTPSEGPIGITATITRRSTDEPLGMLVSERANGDFTVDDTAPAGCCREAGIERHDKLVAVGGKSVAGLDLDGVLALLIADTTTEVNVERGGSATNAKVGRAQVALETPTAHVVRGVNLDAWIANIIKRTHPDSDSGGEWTQYKVYDGVTMWKGKSPPEGPVQGSVVAVRARAKFDLPVAVVMGLISDRSTKGKWDDAFNSVVEVEDVDGRWCSIVNERFNGIWPVPGRDFCVMQHVALLEDGTGVMVAQDFADKRVPEKSPYVRGSCIAAGFVIYPEDGGKSCTVNYLASSDLKGSLPGWVLMMVVERQPMNVWRLRGLARKLSADERAHYATEVPAVKVAKAAPGQADGGAADSQAGGQAAGGDGDDGDKAAQELVDRLMPGSNDVLKSSSLLLDPCMFNTSKIRKACIPSANGHFTARALARFYAALANDGSIDGARIMSEAMVRAMSEERASVSMNEMMPEMKWGLGVRKFSDTAFGESPLRAKLVLVFGFARARGLFFFRACAPRNNHGLCALRRVLLAGHGGLGGSIALCDPAHNLSVAVTVNKLTLEREPARRVIEEVCESLQIPMFEGLKSGMAGIQ